MAQAADRVDIIPQPGPQTAFMACDADIVVYGGAAGGGKSWALLLDALYYAALQPVKGFHAVIFRRTVPQITQEGGLWDQSNAIYPLFSGVPKDDPKRWIWAQYQTRIRFAQMQHEKDRFNWQGSEIPYIGFDELTHFEERQFFYMLSRNRSLCGVRPRIRATTNPDPDSWVKRFLAPWVDDTYPDPALPGEVRYFYRDGDQIVWLHAPSECPESIDPAHVKSVTFIPATLDDNPKLLERDPGYKANLMALDHVERERLLKGNWNIRTSGNLFKRHWFPIVDVPPADFERKVRRWDLAATELSEGNKDPDWTAGVLLGKRGAKYYILDVVHERKNPGEIEDIVKRTAEQDGRGVQQSFEQEPGSSGKKVVSDYKTLLDGYDVRGTRPTGDKVTRARAFSAQAEGGNVILVRAWWNDTVLNELCAFPAKGIHDDIVDGCTGGHEVMSGVGGVPVAISGGSAAEQPASDGPTDYEAWERDQKQQAIIDAQLAARAPAITNFLSKHRQYGLEEQDQ